MNEQPANVSWLSPCLRYAARGIHLGARLGCHLYFFPDAKSSRQPNNPAIVRTKRVKEARDDAKKEIADYKAKKDEDFKKFEAEVRLAPTCLHRVVPSSKFLPPSFFVRVIGEREDTELCFACSGLRCS